MKEKECAYCGELFSPRSWNQKYCKRDHYTDCQVCGEKVFVKSLKNIPKTCGKTECISGLMKTFTKTCEVCGDEFESKVSWGRFCSKQHYETCVVCGEEFKFNPNQPAQTCSKACAAGITDFEARNKKSGETWKERYGEEITNPSQLDFVKEKKKETVLENYGVENPSLSPEIRAKAESTLIERYGVDNPAKSPELMKKIAETNLKRYGVVNTFQHEEFKKKAVETLRKKYGLVNIINPSQIPEIKERIEETNLRKYGHRSYLGSEEFQSNPRNHNHRRISNINRSWQKTLLEMFGKEFQFEIPFGENRYADLGYGDLLIDINPTVTHNVSVSFACTISGCETDCSREDHQPIHKYEHHDRFLEAEADGKTLLQYFDYMDEDIFLSIVRAKLKMDEVRIGARETIVQKISQRDANRFFEENHLLGGTRGQEYCVGLFHEGELVHVNSFGKSRFNENFEWEAIRSCSKKNYHVQGGLQKADAFFFRNVLPSSVISYVDLALGGGEAESKNPGWELLRVNKPSSVWVNLLGEDDLPTVVKSTTAAWVSADRLLGLEVGEKYPTHHEDGSKFSNADVLLSEGYVELYPPGNKVFGWNSSN